MSSIVQKVRERDSDGSAERRDRRRWGADDPRGSAHDTPFKQQMLWVWTPRWTSQWVIGTLLTVGMVCLALGVGITVTSFSSVSESALRYDDLPQCKAVEGTDNTCVVSVPIVSSMLPPVFFYYKLTSFYQNHRRYVRSRSDDQLEGGIASSNDCAPLSRYGDGFHGPNASLDAMVLYPCGLLANSYFRDNFTSPCVLASPSASTCQPLTGADWSQDHIAWPSDLKGKFKPRPLFSYETNQSPLNFTFPPVNEPTFVVWMRAAPFSTFSKLNRVVSTRGFKAGEVLNLTITNRYRTDFFGGHKYVVLTTSSWIGTKNNFLGIAYLVTSFICLSATIVFTVNLHRLPQSELEPLEPSELSDH